MSKKAFYTLLIGTSIISLGIAAVFQIFPAYSPYLNFNLTCIGIFMILSILVFVFGKRAALSDSKYQFIYLVMFNIFFKVIASLILIIVYNNFFEPPNRLFIIPFIFIYILFTCFETYMMVKLSRLKPESNAQG